MQIPKTSDKIFNLKHARTINDWMKNYIKRLAKETGNNDFLKIHFHTLRHFAISWHYFKTKDIVDTQRFARHCDIRNTLKYVHIIKLWIRENEYDVVYATDKEELTKYLKEGYELLTKTEWGYCLRKPKCLIQ
jgi:integrase